ncbi:hypothetical protein [Streptomyces sp. NRRL S-350]|uniref:hypothetical protein n=1 Tax=Streptomyces sp. NRRL S-350 TaxID=1463902 RepID=UPI00068F6C6A|nr:hypothetical protein [Streptomyces sp. NRRL S-350]
MSTNRSRRIDRDAAEQLLGGAVGGPSAGQEASLTGPDGGPGQLARVLAAAAAPATAAELVGEEAALAAFREASLTPDPVVTPVRRRRPMTTAALAKAFSTKAVAAVLGATALCGVAVAAGTGNLPSLGGSPAEPEHSRAAGGGASGTSAAGQPGFAPPSGSAKPSGSGAPQAGPSTARTPGTPSADGHGGRSATPELVALCHGYLDRSGRGEGSGQLVTEPQFGPLVTAAEGAEKVAEYCGEALGTTGGDSRPGTGAPSHEPGRNAGSPTTGAGKGGGDEPKGGGDGNATGGARPGKPGVTVPTPPAAPASPPATRPGKSDRTDGPPAER